MISVRDKTTIADDIVNYRFKNIFLIRQYYDLIAHKHYYLIIKFIKLETN